MPAAHHASNPSAPRSRPGQEFSLEAWAKLLHRTVSAVAAVPLPDVALQLFLSAAVVASRAPGLDLVTYDMFEQARAGKRWKRREGPRWYGSLSASAGQGACVWLCVERKRFGESPPHAMARRWCLEFSTFPAA